MKPLHGYSALVLAKTQHNFSTNDFDSLIVKLTRTYFVENNQQINLERKEYFV